MRAGVNDDLERLERLGDKRPLFYCLPMALKAAELANISSYLEVRR
jgi:hypothetical protein